MSSSTSGLTGFVYVFWSTLPLIPIVFGLGSLAILIALSVAYHRLYLLPRRRAAGLTDDGLFRDDAEELDGPDAGLTGPWALRSFVLAARAAGKRMAPPIGERPVIWDVWIPWLSVGPQSRRRTGVARDDEGGVRWTEMLPLSATKASPGFPPHRPPAKGQAPQRDPALARIGVVIVMPSPERARSRRPHLGEDSDESTLEVPSSLSDDASTGKDASAVVKPESNSTKKALWPEEEGEHEDGAMRAYMLGLADVPISQ